ncbi:MAX dimerization protein MGA a isoform X2 [Erpetoichthys calabaricus]|uniref:MAX dimerization protein MGA a isoform X2 n=1 Tax=Erpetoichthys calabaricus TaxID=27687 RepID=UPI0022349251|nr:MAX dimerization protein MGA a isoform X2 [Erpetoichthys calabaricus]
MENQATMVLRPESGNIVSPSPAASAPTFFVILKQGQTGEDGNDQQGILVANKELNLPVNTATCLSNTSLPMLITPKAPSPEKTVSSVKSTVDNLSAVCSCKGVRVTLDNNNMWNEFYRCNTEMILTKQGRRMFPYCRFRISGLEHFQRYILVMDINPVDNVRYKWNGQFWEACDKAEPHILGRVFIHPESPSSGHYWMQQPVSFYKLKLTNNPLDPDGHIILHSMHRYLPRLHIVPADKTTEVIQLSGPEVMTFTFPQTEFFAVTAYQNLRITQLKIDYNPFAKGFREEGQCCRPSKPKLESSSDLEGSEAKSVLSAIDLSKSGTKVNVDGVKLPLKTLKSLFHTNEPPDELLDQEFFNNKDYDIGLMENNPLFNTRHETENKSSCNTMKCAYVTDTTSTTEFKDNNVRIKEEPFDDYDYCTGSVLDCVDRVIDSHGSLKEKELLNAQQKYGPTGVAKAKMIKQESGKKPLVLFGLSSPSKSTRISSETSNPDISPLTFAKTQNSSYTPAAVMPNIVLTSQSSYGKSLKAAVFERPVNHQKPRIKRECTISNLRAIAPKPDSMMNTEPSPSNAKSVSCSNGISTEDTWKKSRYLSNKIKCSSTLKTESPTIHTFKKRRSRKVRFGKGRSYRKMAISSAVSAMEITPDTTMQPDLEDVEGVLFVSFSCKEALEVHLGDQLQTEEIKAPQKSLDDMEERITSELVLDTEPVILETEPEIIARQEKRLLNDLKHFRYKQVIHPVLQEVGIKLSLIDPTLAIDLQWLGVKLPLPPPVRLTDSREYPVTQDTCTADGNIPFISRTGKTNDFTKIKGWREKFNLNTECASSKSEGPSCTEAILKNRSAFCSDVLDEYLENEGKLIDERAASFSPAVASSQVVYQLPTKSTSYVLTLDSVLKKQAPPSPFPSLTFKPIPALPKKLKPMPTHTITSKVVASKSAIKRKKFSHLHSKPGPKSSVNRKLPGPHRRSKPGPKPKQIQIAPLSMSPPPEVIKSALSDNLDMVENIDVVYSKQDENISEKASVSPRSVGLAKSVVKLMDLEDGARWEGKTRTFITEERAEVALSSLLTAQGTLKSKPSCKITKRRTPPCLNDYCRLGCVCASLAQERKSYTHCRKPECMFGCTCLKRKVVLVKTVSKRKKLVNTAIRENLIFYGALGEEQQTEPETKPKKKKKRRIEYAISEPEPEPEPVPRVLSLWNRQEEEIDPEPVFVPESSPVLPPTSPPLSPKIKRVKYASGRGYTQSPPIKDEDKDPVYLYFESLMTCARVRGYSKTSPKPCSSMQGDILQNIITQDVQGDKMRSPQKVRNKRNALNNAKKTKLNTSMRSVSKEPRKQVEVISNCNWDSGRSKILNTLSQKMNSSDEIESFSVGGYNIEMVSQTRKRDSSGLIIVYKIRITPSEGDDIEAEATEECEEDQGLMQNELNKASQQEEQEMIVKEPPTEQTAEKELPVRKALPLYTGVSPAGILTAKTKDADSAHQADVEVNGKSYPQAKLLLGQMGALHPANRLAAYITGRLRPSSSDLSHLTLSMSKMKGTEKENSKEGVNPKEGLSKHQQLVSSSTLAVNTTIPSVKAISGDSTNKQPQSTKANPAKIATPLLTVPSGIKLTEQNPGTRLLLIPVQSGSTNASTSSVPLGPPPGQKLILQPIRSATGTNLYRHPNGQIIQLVPLNQLRAGVSSNPQQMIIQKTVPTLTAQTAPQQPASDSTVTTNPVLSASLSSGNSVKSGVESPISPPPAETTSTNTGSLPSTISVNSAPATQQVAASSFVSQPGTLTLRISPQGLTKVVSSGQETKLITCNSSVEGGNSTGFLPLQASSFALLQVPKSSSTPTTNIVPKVQVEIERCTQGYKKFIPIIPSNKPKLLDNIEIKDESKKISVLVSNEKKEEHSVEEARTSSIEIIEKDLKKPCKSDDEKVFSNKIDTAAVSTNLSCNNDENLNEEVKDTKIDHSYTSSQESLQESSCPVADKTASPPTHRSSIVNKTVLDLKTQPVLVLCGSSKISATTLRDAVAIDANAEKPQVCGQQPDASDSDQHIACGSPLSEQKVECKSRSEFLQDPLEDCQDLTEKLSKSIKEKMGDISDDCYKSETEDDLRSTEDNTDEWSVSSDVGSIDIETVEELSEKSRIERMKDSIADLKLDKVKRKALEKDPDHLPSDSMEDLQYSGSAQTSPRLNHTATERMRRFEIRFRFDKLKEMLGLQDLPKASKFYILKQACNEIQALVDQCDRLEAQKNLLIQKRSTLIKKTAVASGKTEDMILKKLEYICSKQKILEAQRKKAGKSASTPSTVKDTEKTIPSPKSISEAALSIDCLASTSATPGKPLILSRKKLPSKSTKDVISGPSMAETPFIKTSANIALASQAQLISLNTPLVCVSPAGSAVLQPSPSNVATKIEGLPVSSIPGISSVTIQLPGLSLPLQMKNCVSDVGKLEAEKIGHPAEQEGNEDSVMPTIVNVTSLASSNAFSLMENWETSLSQTVPSPLLLGAENHESPLQDRSHTVIKNRQNSVKLTEVSKEDLSEDEEHLQKDPGQCISKDTVEQKMKKRTKCPDKGFIPSQGEEATSGHEQQEHEALSTLLNEIVFLNQFNNKSENSHLAETPLAQRTHQPHGGRLSEEQGSEVDCHKLQEDADGTPSPLVLQLDEDTLETNQGGKTENVNNSSTQNPSDCGPDLNCSSSSSSSDTLSPPPLLQMKVGSNTTGGKGDPDFSWRPMPRLVPLGLKVSNNLDSSIQSTKAMPTLASVSAGKEATLAGSSPFAQSC